MKERKDQNESSVRKLQGRFSRARRWSVFKASLALVLSGALFVLGVFFVQHQLDELRNKMFAQERIDTTTSEILDRSKSLMSFQETVVNSRRVILNYLDDTLNLLQHHDDDKAVPKVRYWIKSGLLDKKYWPCVRESNPDSPVGAEIVCDVPEIEFSGAVSVGPRIVIPLRSKTEIRGTLTQATRRKLRDAIEKARDTQRQKVREAREEQASRRHKTLEPVLRFARTRDEVTRYFDLANRFLLFAFFVAVEFILLKILLNELRFMNELHRAELAFHTVEAASKPAVHTANITLSSPGFESSQEKKAILGLLETIKQRVGPQSDRPDERARNS